MFLFFQEPYAKMQRNAKMNNPGPMDIKAPDVKKILLNTSDFGSNTVDGSEILRSPPMLVIKPVVNNGINMDKLPTSSGG